MAWAIPQQIRLYADIDDLQPAGVGIGDGLVQYFGQPAALLDRIELGRDVGDRETQR